MTAVFAYAKDLGSALIKIKASDCDATLPTARRGAGLPPSRTLSYSSPCLPITTTIILFFQ